MFDPDRLENTARILSRMSLIEVRTLELVARDMDDTLGDAICSYADDFENWPTGDPDAMFEHARAALEPVAAASPVLR